MIWREEDEARGHGAGFVRRLAVRKGGMNSDRRERVDTFYQSVLSGAEGKKGREGGGIAGYANSAKDAMWLHCMSTAYRYST